MKTLTITTFEDILEALQENPKWREQMRAIILSEELLTLPQRFESFVRDEFRPLKKKVDKLETDVEVLKQDVEVLKQDVEVLKQDVAVLKQDVEVLKQDVAVLKQDVAVLKQDVAVLKQDVEVLKQDVAVLKQDVAVLKQDVAVLKQDVAVLKQDVEVLKQDVRGLKVDVASLKGESFELRIRDRAAAFFGKLLRRTKVINSERLVEALDDALDTGAITDSERDDVLNVDVVVKGKLKGSDREVILVGEVSVTVDLEDVERADFRAKVVSRAFNMEAIGVVVGKEITDRAKNAADELAVLVL